MLRSIGTNPFLFLPLMRKIKPQKAEKWQSRSQPQEIPKALETAHNANSSAFVVHCSGIFLTPTNRFRNFKSFPAFPAMRHRSRDRIQLPNATISNLRIAIVKARPAVATLIPTLFAGSCNA
jgi:hypothetical protein